MANVTVSIADDIKPLMAIVEELRDRVNKMQGYVLVKVDDLVPEVSRPPVPTPAPTETPARAPDPAPKVDPAPETPRGA